MHAGSSVEFVLTSVDDAAVCARLIDHLTDLSQPVWGNLSTFKCCVDTYFLRT